MSLSIGLIYADQEAQRLVLSVIKAYAGKTAHLKVSLELRPELVITWAFTPPHLGKTGTCMGVSRN